MNLAKNNKTVRKTMAILLLLAFVVPSVVNALHYSFIEHLPHHHSKVESISSFHKNCELDDYSFGQSTDVYDDNTFVENFIDNQQITDIQISYIFAYRHYTFLLRAPPAFL